LKIALIILFVGTIVFFTPSKKLSFSSLIRSLAIELRNARERLEAYKFIRRFVHLYPLKIPHSFVYVLDSIVSSSYLSHLNRPMNSSVIIRSDQMIKCSLELLCEIGKITKPFNLSFLNEMKF
jgi:hypothetical protein